MQYLNGLLHFYITLVLDTETMLLSVRPLDSSVKGFKNWNFMSVHNWGERPDGVWKLKIRDGVCTI